MGIPSPAVVALSGWGDAPFTPEPPGYASYALSEFSEVRLVLLRRVCGLLFFLDYL